MVAKVSEWTPDEELLHEVETQFERAVAAYRANPNLITEHANHEESIRVGGYSSRTLLELVQNAADAMSGLANDGTIEDAGRVEIVLDLENEALYCANAGRPFSRQGFTSLAHAHLSGKRGDEIGRFGLGFKSVLAVTSSPQVYSRTVSFGFNSKVAHETLETIPSNAKRFPVLRTAVPLDPHEEIRADPVLSELATWAVTIIKLPNLRNISRLRREIETFKSEFLLFVNSVRTVNLRIIGNEDFSTSHVSRGLGNNIYKLEKPDGTGDEWIVENRMHRPSTEARKMVGEAVSRDEVKVTVAVPAHLGRDQKIGRFWSYFPLENETSASALFNAPWSVNDDRTNLLRNQYNREILETLSEMFAGTMPRLSTPDDPGAHLDYLPARVREDKGYANDVICDRVPRLTVDVPLIPDANGELRRAKDLRPLDFEVPIEVSMHQAWSNAPNTGTDVPHWRCYTTTQRALRLRELFAATLAGETPELDSRDMKRSLQFIQKRGLLTWLLEWADSDVHSAANALRFVVGHRSLEKVDQAKVIPTTHGLQTLSDRNTIFLRQIKDIPFEESAFVQPDFLAVPGVEKLLRDNGFRDLDPIAILQARTVKLTSEIDDELLTKFWDAVLNVSSSDALLMLRKHPHAPIRVPTLDGGWAWPQQVVDLGEDIGDKYNSLTLDRHRCVPTVAAELGVVSKPVPDFAFEDEVYRSDYRSWVVEQLNYKLGPGERPVERIDLYPSQGKTPGPFSLLFVLEEAGATMRLREEWTRNLLAYGDAHWDCEDVDSHANHRVSSPIKWAVEKAGILNSTLGYRRPQEIVSSSLVEFKDLLPLYIGPRNVADLLHFPENLENIPASIFKTALAAELLPSSVPDEKLVEFILAAGNRAYSGSKPPKIPARVGKSVEARPPSSVFLAVTDEQQEYLSARQKPYFRTTEEIAEELVSLIGCQRFEDSFSFSTLIEGELPSERILDVFTGLRTAMITTNLSNATIARAAHISKLVTTEDGVEPQSLNWHLAGDDLYVPSDLEERHLLSTVNQAFELGLSNQELKGIEQAGLEFQLSRLREDALAAPNDEERLEVYFGDDDLRETLPKGLWQALEAQQLVGPKTSIAHLYLTVYGTDSLRLLQDLFLREGFPDVPTEWAGGPSTISWLRKMGFSSEYAGKRAQPSEDEFLVPGAVKLNDLHSFQKTVSLQMGEILTEKDDRGRRLKALVELPTGAGKTRVATETVLRMFIDGQLTGPVLWIAQSQELCEQAVQTWSNVWRGLGDERPLSIARLWSANRVHEPETEFSIVVATDAKLAAVENKAEYQWLRSPSAVIVDEGHRAGDSERYTKILRWLGVDGRSFERPLIGLTATPFKGTSADATKRLLSRFGNRLLRPFEGNAHHELVKLGVLAKVDHKVLPTGFDVNLTAQERRDAVEKRLIAPEALDRIAKDQVRMRVLVDEIIKLDSSWPVLVFTPNVLSAQVLAATLRYRGIEAAAVSGQTGRQERRDVISKFKQGKIQVLANCDLLIQGFDAPGVRALFIARPTFSPNAYIQMAGRGLRGPANGGKEECLIVDMADNFGASDDLLGFRDYEQLWTEQSS